MVCKSWVDSWVEDGLSRPVCGVGVGAVHDFLVGIRGRGEEFLNNAEEVYVAVLDSNVHTGEFIGIEYNVIVLSRNRIEKV